MTVKLTYFDSWSQANREKVYRNIHPKSIEVTHKYIYFSHSEPTYPAYTNAAPYQIERESIVSIEFINESEDK